MKLTLIVSHRLARLSERRKTFTLVLMINDNRLVIVYESNFAAICLLIKYQKNIFMCMNFSFLSFISHYCTAVSFERVVHPNRLGFTFISFFFFFFLHQQYDGIGGGQYLLFSFSLLVLMFQQFFFSFFRVEREAFRWHEANQRLVCMRGKQKKKHF